MIYFRASCVFTYVSYFFAHFDDCYLCSNLFAEHPVFISRFSYLVLISLITLLIAQTSRRQAFSRTRVSRAFPADATRAHGGR